MSLSLQVVRFAQRLRERGVAASPAEVVDALRALQVVSLLAEPQFRMALRLNLCAKQEDLPVFDEEYQRFFRGPDLLGDEYRPPDMARRKSGKDHTSSPKPSARRGDLPGEGAQPVPVWGTAAQGAENRTEQTIAWSMLPNAPWNAKKQMLLQIPPQPSPWLREAAKQLVAAVRLRERRKWETGRRGSSLHFRRTIRRSMPLGGEPLLLSWKKRACREARFLLFCDGSRSMSGFAEAFLQFASALSTCTNGVEVFLFSTRLRRISSMLASSNSRAVQGGAAAASKRATDRILVDADEWGGGTRIGESLHAFLHTYGRSMLRKNTVVLIGSDGLDTGEPRRLEEAMRTIASKAAYVIWLNPLLTMQGYRPEAQGMQAALPFLDLFTYADDPGSYRRLAESIRLGR